MPRRRRRRAAKRKRKTTKKAKKADLNETMEFLDKLNKEAKAENLFSPTLLLGEA